MATRVTGSSVLDIGCADGRLLAFLAPDAYAVRYIGLDGDEKAIVAAKSDHPDKEFHCMFVSAGAEFPFEGKFDCIVMSAFIEHVGDPEALLKRLSGMLNPGGRIVMTTPTDRAESFLRLGSRIGIFDRRAFEEHKNHFSQESLTNMLAAAGFRLEYYGKFQLGLNQLAVAHVLT